MRRLIVALALTLLAGAAHADAVHDAAVQRHLPAALVRAMDAALAGEGESLPLYDTLRAWAILSGQADWSPAYLAGWLSDRAGAMPDLQPLVLAAPLR